MVKRPPEINLRQQNIIHALLTAHGKSTLAELAEQTSLSSRVVRYNLDIVKSWMRACDVQFINRPGYGLEVVASRKKDPNCSNRSINWMTATSF